jgi:hypothetical protein
MVEHRGGAGAGHVNLADGVDADVPLEPRPMEDVRESNRNPRAWRRGLWHALLRGQSTARAEPSRREKTSGAPRDSSPPDIAARAALPFRSAARQLRLACAVPTGTQAIRGEIQRAMKNEPATRKACMIASKGTLDFAYPLLILATAVWNERGLTVEKGQLTVEAVGADLHERGHYGV